MLPTRLAASALVITPVAPRYAARRELRAAAHPRLLADPVRLSGLPLHTAEPHSLAARGKPGVLPAVSGAAVPVHRQKPHRRGRGHGPGRRRRGHPAVWRGPGLQPAAPALAGPTYRPARPCGGGAGLVPLQLLPGAGPGRAPGRRPGSADGGSADWRVRAAGERGGGVAHGARWPARLLGRAAAQPLDHRHGHRPGGECAGPAHPPGWSLR